MRRFGLIGKSLSHSFSKSYFEKKFKEEKLDNCSYLNFELENLENIRSFIFKNNLNGFNVTIPYKEKIIKHLDSLSLEAKEIGAVNCVSVEQNKLVGHNTDWYGFSKSLIPLLETHHDNALILGTGGASKAIAYALKKLKINYKFVSRVGQINYQNIDQLLQNRNFIIINTTPLGTFPNENTCPDLPYNLINEDFLLFDLVYNPKKTKFLQLGSQKECKTKNGLEMLSIQAEKSWEIWIKNIKS